MDRHIHHCIEAAVLRLDEGARRVKLAGIERLFDALRAPITVPFSFDGYVEFTWGMDPSKMVHPYLLNHLPDLALLNALHTAFQQWEKVPGLCSLLAVRRQRVNDDHFGHWDRSFWSKVTKILLLI